MKTKQMGLSYAGLLVATLALSAFQATAQTSLISNVKGYTLQDNRLRTFSAISFTDGTINALYSPDDTLPSGANLIQIDGQGLTLLPGLIDAHGHVLGYGLSLLQVKLRGSKSEREAVDKVITFRKNNSQLNWIQGQGWNQVLWPSKAFPSMHLLDKAFPNTPVWLARIDGHAGWANSAAMKLANVDANTQAPVGGEIVRDSKGEPTGIFIDNAMLLITRHIPPLTVEEQKKVLLTSLNELAKKGLTSVHDAGIGASTIEAYKALDQAKRLPIRVYAMIDATDPEFDFLMKAGPSLSDLGHSDMLAINSVKISADGALGSRGAALISDYSDLPGHKGLLLYPKAKLHSTMKQAMEAGFQVNTHAIGDEANKQVLDEYQTLIKQTHTQGLRHRIEHAQVLRLSDIPRFAKLGIIASMQATHATSDKNMAQDRLGEKRIEGAYAWQKLLQTGAIIAAGSDFPIESPNPFYGLHASVTRQDHYNRPKAGWFKEDRMTLTQALTSFTYSAAYAAHQENMIGTLKSGMKADFILINQDIFSIKPELIWQTKVKQTWVNGRLQGQPNNLR
jgi:predicted amidohydrolase YtcJ